jgi:hypothetical protein
MATVVREDEMLDIQELAIRAGLLMYEYEYPYLRRFADLVAERERERAVMICHQLRDVEYPTDEIAERILNKK